MPRLRRTTELLLLLAAIPLPLCAGAEDHDDGAARAHAEQPERLGALGMLARLQDRGAPLQQRLTAALQANDLEAADAVCRQYIEQLSFSPEGYYNLACVHARRGEKDAAFEQLRLATVHGFNNVEHIRSDPDLEPLRGDDRFDEIIELARKSPGVTPTLPVEPAAIVDGVALVADGNTALDPRANLFVPLFAEAPEPDRSAELTSVEGTAGDKVRAWWKDGTAAGFRGDVYDNRDGDHSDLSRGLFPLLNRIEYGPEARALQLHSGLPLRIMHQGVILGNASVAWTGGPLWRSMPRMATSDARGIVQLVNQYAHNQLYVYPCHHDYLAGRNGHNGEGSGGYGDVYFANTPYLVTSQGSSYTDQPFLQAFALTLAAFRPDVKEQLVQRKILSPTLQAIFRQCNRAVATPEDYFSGAAHRAVFRGEDVDADRMVTMAHELTIDAIPPVALIKVEEEDEGFVQGRDYFDPAPNEHIFDTPAAVARVMRASQLQRRLVVTANPSLDFQKRPLTYRWSLLQGRPDLVTIRPLDEQQSRVEITVSWHNRFPVAPGSELETNRVDIGCFVSAGSTWSAPAFVSFYCPDNEERLYDEQGRIESIQYRDNYADPFLVNRKHWRDEYHYDALGKPTGWTRRRGLSTWEFTADGLRIIAHAADGTPTETTAVEYKAIAPDAGTAPLLQQMDVEREK